METKNILVAKQRTKSNAHEVQGKMKEYRRCEHIEKKD